MAKRHKKQVQGQAAGGIVEVEAPIHVSNVRLVNKSGRGKGKE
jgi:ribosomal protein L24